MIRLSSLILTSLYLSNTLASSPSLSPWGVNVKMVTSMPRGGSSDGNASYSSVCEDVKASIIEAAHKEIESMRTKIMEEGTTIDSFGSKADTLCNQALEQFAIQAPDTGDNASYASTYNKKLQELEAALDAPLHVLYLRQLSLLREQALQSYRSASHVTETSDYEAMLNADSQFTASAEESTREGSDWDFSNERSYLQQIMNDLARTHKKLMDVQMKSSEKMSTAMAFLQQQQQMIQQLQMQLYGQDSPWNVGMAYRVPDTNFNLQGSYQQGRANVQLSCVPDEYAPMLGANGFTNGVGPGNLGLSLNLSV